ncbi:MAG: nucleotidyltransferase domain-containing protein [Chitinophagaceae bacterium]|nr:nucleotidyltransferase domain-containing protein [Chitinophagaceae bacterium]
MVILFGSYAKGKQVEHRYTGKDGIRYEYISDYDFLVVTKNNTIKEYELEDIINNRTSRFEPSINLQIHEIDYINEGLEFGQYFFTDIVNEGILLFNTGGVHFAPARELTREEEKKKLNGILIFGSSRQ